MQTLMDYRKDLDWVEKYFEGCECEEDVIALENLEKLLRDYKDCKNELCKECGRYRREYLNACTGCRWYE